MQATRWASSGASKQAVWQPGSVASRLAVKSVWYDVCDPDPSLYSLLAFSVRSSQQCPRPLTSEMVPSFTGKTPGRL